MKNSWKVERGRWKVIVIVNGGTRNVEGDRDRWNEEGGTWDVER